MHGRMQMEGCSWPKNTRGKSWNLAPEEHMEALIRMLHIFSMKVEKLKDYVTRMRLKK